MSAVIGVREGKGGSGLALAREAVEAVRLVRLVLEHEVEDAVLVVVLDRVGRRLAVDGDGELAGRGRPGRGAVDPDGGVALGVELRERRLAAGREDDLR